MELEFKEGERVFDIRYGWGTIKEPINECFTAVIFDKDRIIECYDERNAVTMLSYEEYELHGRWTIPTMKGGLKFTLESLK